MSRVLLEVNELTTKYVTRFWEDIYAVDHVSLKVEEGKSIGIAGESGCGKSTLALSLMGYYFAPLHYSSGEIIVDGQNITGMDPDNVRRTILGNEISYIPQAAMNALNPTQKVINFIEDVVQAHHPNTTKQEIYELARALDAQITPEVATCLYCAVGTDSGYFRYKNTTPALLRMAAEMIECGADPKGIAEATLDRYDPSVVRLGGAALSSLEVRLDGRAAVGVLLKKDFDRAGTTQTEGVIDYLRSVAGVDLLILIR